MNNQANRATFLAKNARLRADDGPAIVTLKLPDVEEIARAIWQRQHDALDREAITHDLKWRDPSVPTKFWDQFLLDAQAVLAILQKKHVEYRRACES